MRYPLASGFEGPLAPYADTIARRLHEQGDASWTVQDKLHVVAKLSQWLDEQRVCAFLREFQEDKRRACHGDPTTLRGLLKQLSGDGVIPEPRDAADAGAQAEIVQEFSRYLTQQRGLSAATIDNYVAVVAALCSNRT